MSQIGHRIRTLREQKKLNQIELAKLANTRQSTISDIEKGKINPSVATVGRLADALGISLSNLFEGVESCPN